MEAQCPEGISLKSARDIIRGKPHVLTGLSGQQVALLSWMLD